jgi:transcriptional regulator with XRE-family HTH domain
MNGEQLIKERLSRNWEQQEAASRLKVSQPYLSLIEAGKRPLTEKLARRAARVFNLPPTALPVEYQPPQTTRSKNENRLASQLAALGYPKFSHLKKTRRVNPASILISALVEDELDSRVIEALPWLALNFSDLDWTEVIKAAKLEDAQNRLGFLLSLAYNKAKNSKDEKKTALFKELLSSLEKSRLARDDSFRRLSLTESEKRWLRKNRPPNARRWHVLSNLTAEHLIY